MLQSMQSRRVGHNVATEQHVEEDTPFHSNQRVYVLSVCGCKGCGGGSGKVQEEQKQLQRRRKVGEGSGRNQTCTWFSRLAVFLLKIQIKLLPRPPRAHKCLADVVKYLRSVLQRHPCTVREQLTSSLNTSPSRGTFQVDVHDGESLSLK